MSQPAAEYAVLLESIERLAFELGQIDMDLADLRRRASRLEARVIQLTRSGAVPIQVPEPLETVWDEPVIPDTATVPVAGGSPVFAPVERAPAGSPSFIRIVPSTVTTQTGGLEAVHPPIDTVPARVARELAAAPARPPIWSRVPERYRRAAWIGAPILVVMVVSTWMTSAGSDEVEPTMPSYGGMAGSRTATISIQSTPSRATSLPVDATPPVSVTMTRASSPSSATTPSRPSDSTPAALSESSTAPVTIASATGTVSLPATIVPSPTETTPGTETSSPSPSATSTETPESATVVPQGEIVPGGVGSTETMVVETFGTADAEQDGRTSYSGGSVLVEYGAESLAVWLTFVLDVDDLEMQLEDADVLASYYRPPDAQLLSQETVEPGFVRRIYTSATLASLFEGTDNGGRANDRYVEELRFDPATERARLIEMALGDRP